MRVLVLNAGSSSLKASVVETDGDVVAATEADWPPSADDGDAARSAVQAALGQLPTDVRAVGYRVVHGGDAYTSAAPVDGRLLAAVDRLDELAPLHNRRAASVMRAGRALIEDVPHVACFDTAFHAGLPEEAWRYALPPDWVEAHGIRRYGFHGLSVAWSVRRAAEVLGDRLPSPVGVIVAHLGSGSSVTAAFDGRSMATSMGFTPFEGLVMGTRSGSIDPGILLHLLAKGIPVGELAEGLARRSGLGGLGGSADVRDLLERADAGEARARLALDVFTRSAAAHIAAAATALPRIDALVFTGGIGEHAEPVREAIVHRLAAIGFPPELRSASDDACLADGPPAVLMVRAQEDRIVAELVADLLAGPA